MEDLVLSIPTQDAALIETLAQRMGWTMRRVVTTFRSTSASRSLTKSVEFFFLFLNTNCH